MTPMHVALQYVRGMADGTIDRPFHYTYCDSTVYTERQTSPVVIGNTVGGAHTVSIIEHNANLASPNNGPANLSLYTSTGVILLRQDSAMRCTQRYTNHPSQPTLSFSLQHPLPCRALVDSLPISVHGDESKIHALPPDPGRELARVWVHVGKVFGLH